MLETGENGFLLESIGEFTDLEAFCAALDDLDETTGNVILGGDEQHPVFDVTISRHFEGTSGLDIQALGLIELAGKLTVGADVTMHITFGLDASGFFIDPDADTDPEFVISNLSVDEVEGHGKFGFLGVEVVEASLVMDEDVRIEIDYVPPGPGPFTEIDDGLIRIDHLTDSESDFVETTLVNDPVDDDFVLTAAFEASAILPGLAAPFSLAGAEVEITWADINSLLDVEVSASTSAGDDLVQFLNVGVEQFVEDLSSAADRIDDALGVDILATPLPILNKSLADILGGDPDPLVFEAEISGVSPIETTDEGSSFTFTLAESASLADGINIGDAVVYRGIGGIDFEGTISAVELARFTVLIAGGPNQDPDFDNPRFEIHRGGKLGDGLKSTLGSLLEPQSASVKTPTLQSLIQQIGVFIGVDPASIGVQLTGSGSDLAVTIDLPLNPDPIVFEIENAFDLGSSVPGLVVEGSGTASVTVDPSFQVGVGVRLGDGVAATERFFIVENDAAEATLTVTAQLDNPDLTAMLGFLGVQIEEDPAVANNRGIIIDATVTVDFADPGSGADADGRITLDELATGGVSNVFDADIDANFAIDGLLITTNPPLPDPLPPIGISLDGDVGGHVLNLPQLLALPSRIVVTGLENYQGFDQLSFSQIISLLRAMADWLGQLEGFEFLAQDLPVIGFSVSDALAFTEEFVLFVDRLENDPAGAIQEVEAKLKLALGLAPNAPEVDLTYDGEELGISLTFVPVAYSDEVDFNLDLSSFGGNLDGLESLIGFDATGKLDVDLAATIQVDFGISFANPQSPRFYVRDTTGVEVTAEVRGENLDFSAWVGPVEVFVVDGSVTLDKDGDPATMLPATLSVSLAADANGYTIDLDTPATTELSLGSVEPIMVMGGAEISLPIHYPDEVTALTPDLEISLPDLFDLSTATFTAPNLAALVAGLDFSGDLAAWVEGLEALLLLIEAGLNSEVFGTGLPLVGANMGRAANFVGDVHDVLYPELRQIVNKDPTAIKDELWDLLGDPGLGIIQGTKADIVITPPTPDADTDDLLFTFDLGDSYSVLFGDPNTLAGSPTFDEVFRGLNFDIGIPGLGLDADLPIVVEVGWNMTVSMGVSRQFGAYFDTSASADADDPNFPGGEIEIGFDVYIPELADDTLVQGNLILFLLNVKDGTFTGGDCPDTSGAPSNPSFFRGTFAVDILDPDGSLSDPDGARLTFAEMTSPSHTLADFVDPSLGAAAEVNLFLEATFPETGVLASFPSLETAFHLDWSWSFGGGLEGSPPNVEFGNVCLNAGKFFSDFVTPIVDKVRAVLQPLDPIIELLNMRMPIFSDLNILREGPLGFDVNGDGIVTLLELAPGISPSTVTFISAVGELLDEVLDIPVVTGDARILLGSLGGIDVTAPTFDISKLSWSDVNTDVNPNYDSDLGALGQGADTVSNFISSLKEVGSDEATPTEVDIISFPLLEDPLLAFQLLMGQDVELFRFDLPPFELEFAKEISIPIFPALPFIEIDLVGSLAVAMDFAFGYDSQGARKFAESGFSDPSLLLAGLFLDDRNTANQDIDEITFTAGIEAFASLNALLAEIGVGGGIFATIGLNLNDNDNDGKIRGDELAENFPNCIFDTHGALTAALSAKARVGFVTDRFQLADVTLLDYDWSCKEPVDPILGRVDANGELLLYLGDRAASRNVDKSEIDESFTIIHEAGDAGDETVQVVFNGYSQEFAGVSRILAAGWFRRRPDRRATRRVGHDRLRRRRRGRPACRERGRRHASRQQWQRRSLRRTRRQRAVRRRRRRRAHGRAAGGLTGRRTEQRQLVRLRRDRRADRRGRRRRAVWRPGQRHALRRSEQRRAQRRRRRGRAVWRERRGRPDGRTRQRHARRRLGGRRARRAGGRRPAPRRAASRHVAMGKITMTRPETRISPPTSSMARKTTTSFTATAGRMSCTAKWATICSMAKMGPTRWKGAKGRTHSMAAPGATT